MSSFGSLSWRIPILNDHHASMGFTVLIQSLQCSSQLRSTSTLLRAGLQTRPLPPIQAVSTLVVSFQSITLQHPADVFPKPRESILQGEQGQKLAIDFDFEEQADTAIRPLAHKLHSTERTIRWMEEILQHPQPPSTKSPSLGLYQVVQNILLPQ